MSKIVKSEEELKTRLLIVTEDLSSLQKQISEYKKLLNIIEDSAIGLKIERDNLTQELKQIAQSQPDENKKLRQIEIERLRSLMPELLTKLPDKL